MAVGPPRSTHGSKRARCLALPLGLLLGCGNDAHVTLRTVTVHMPRACAADSNAYATYHALGDFEPREPSNGHVLSNVGEALAEIDGFARSLVVEATESDRQWIGEGDVHANGNVDVMLLPWLRSCPLSTQVGSRTGSTLGAIGGRRVLVVGGIAAIDAGGITTRTPAATYVAHLDTGELDPASPDLRTPRMQASATPFGTGGVVAGGIDATGGNPLDSAEVYAPEVNGFDQQHPILLSTPRANHGAVVLATGETLLVGGIGINGRLLNSMEIVDPVARTVRGQNVATLAVARQAPTVLRLASSEILVVGGRDAAGNPVSTVEWFSPDASRATKRARDLVAGTADAYVALQAGGALAVIAPPAGASADFQSVWVISADGSFGAATPIPGSLAQPILFGGAGGAPVLWTGSLWLRWQPWTGAFGAFSVLDDSVAQVSGVAAAPDPGLAMWLDVAAQTLMGLRFDVRDGYSTLGAQALLVADASNLAPDRQIAAGVEMFDPSVGLELGPGTGAFVTARTYADVTIDVDAPTGEPALVVLRDELGNELEVGGVTCPGALAAPGAPSSLHVKRTGADVEWTIPASASGKCGSVGRDARLSVGLRAPGSVARSVARNLRVTRLGPN
jgi:hypothetical protein